MVSEGPDEKRAESCADGVDCTGDVAGTSFASTMEESSPSDEA